MQNDVALVTGGASGIGEATAWAFAARGARVLITDIDDEGGKTLRRQIEQEGGEAHYVHTDAGEASEVEALVEEGLSAFGRLDYACNNAGISGTSAPTADYPIEDWQRVLQINLTGIFLAMKYEIPAMLDSGGGSIVNMASILGQVGFANSAAYVTAKHGMLGLTKSTALEYAQQGIRVNAVCPAFIHTPLIEELEADEETREMLIGLHPMGRLGRPEEVANLVVWLCSEEASFMTGSAHLVDGGYVAR